ncbi:MAG: M10 family metallopeptidase C-terminal domain-containing protein [Rhodocyclales bacterium]|nr:M10 family metallopeptidase C-terminal domain-containing protein [Rhodocyclales bacterium]
MATATDNAVPLTGNPLIDGLTWGAAWQFGAAPHVLTYSLSLNDNPNGGAWNTTLSNAVRAALAAWSNVANISFVEVGGGEVYLQSTADLAFMLTGNELQTGMPGLVGLGLPPSPSLANTLLAAGGADRSFYSQPEGDIALDNYYSGFSYTSPGGVGLTIMLHEIGHALGLKHTDSTYDGRPSFGSLGIANLDSNLYTVMSYTDPSGSQIGTSLGSGNAATPMPLDILAIQQIYGANSGYHTGDDSYQFIDSGAVQTIWDAGGNDTVSASNFGNSNATIDLRAGHFSQVGGSSSRLGIAYGVAIENAVGGLGNDVLLGNEVPNRLDGGAGIDTMVGGAGDDTYVADSAQDVVSESANDGIDTVLASVEFVLPNHVENLSLTGTGTINGTGNGTANSLSGNLKANVLSGGGGDDIFVGGGGRDTLVGGTGSDTYKVGNDATAPNTLTISGDPSAILANWPTGTFNFNYGAFISQNGAYSSNGFSFLLGDSDGDGLANTLSVVASYPSTDLFQHNGFNLSFSHYSLGEALHVGRYTDFVFGYAPNGVSASFSAIGSGVSYQYLSEVNIEAIDIEYGTQTPFLNSLAMSFRYQTSVDAPLTLVRFDYNSSSRWALTDEVAVVELPGEGYDVVESKDSYALPDNVEELRLGGAVNIVGKGNDAENMIVGNAGDNLIQGLGGNDTLSGSFGNDTMIGGAGNDSLNGGFGLDVAVFSGVVTGYTVAKAGKAYTVTDINSANGDDGIDTLTGIERIRFADGEMGVLAEPGMRIGHVEYPAQWLANYVVADFNADGRMDISWMTRAGLTGTWTIDGANVWDADAMNSPFTDWTTVDNNGDGRADVAFQHMAGGGMVQWNSLSLAAQTIPALPIAPEMPTAPPTIPPTPPVSPPLAPPPPEPGWGM